MRSHRRITTPARFALAGLTLLALSACGANDYPSLRRRPIEDMASATPAPPRAEPPNAPVSVELRTRLDGLVARAGAAHAKFLARQAATEKQLADAGHAEVSGPEWTTANEALAELETTRTDAAKALAELEGIYTDDRLEHALDDAPAGTSTTRPVGAAISAARDKVIAMVDTENATLARLEARLPQ